MIDHGGDLAVLECDANGNLISRTEAASGAGSGNGWFYTWSQDDRLTNVALVVDEKVGVHRQTTFAYDAMGRRLLRQDDDGTWTRHFYDGLNVLLEKESTHDPSSWGSFVADDLENGTSNWYAWNGTSLTNPSDTERGSKVVVTSNGTADATRAMVGDDNANTNPNDAVWNAARRAFSLAAQRPEAGVFTLTFYLTTDQGSKRIAYDSWHTSNSSDASGWVVGMGNEPLGSGSSSDWMTISRDIEADIQSIDSARTVTNIDGFRLSRNNLELDDIVLADARTTRIYTLAPSALGGIISIREFERDTYYDLDNVDSWY